MRAFKIVCLCLGAILIALALCGTGASYGSTELCKEAEEPCEAENVYGAGTAIEATSSETLLETSFVTVTCTGSTIKGETAAQAGAPLPAELSTATFTGCKNGGGTECTASSLETPYLGQVEATGENAGTVTVRSGSGGDPAISVVCGTLSCTYATAAIEMSASGGNPGEVVASKEPLEKKSGSFLCPATGTFTATYAIQQPKPINLFRFPTKLCQVAPEKTETTCPTGKQFEGEIEAELTSANATIVSTGPPGTPAGSVTCTKAPMAGKFVSNGSGEIKSISITGNQGGGECAGLLEGKAKNAAVSVSNLPATFSAFSYFGLGVGLLIIDGTKFLELNVLFAGEKEACVYKYADFSLVTKNPEVVGMSGKAELLIAAKLKGPATCPVSVETKGTWEILAKGGGKFWLAEQ